MTPKLKLERGLVIDPENTLCSFHLTPTIKFGFKKGEIGMLSFRVWGVARIEGQVFQYVVEERQK